MYTKSSKFIMHGIFSMRLSPQMDMSLCRY